MGCHKNCPHDRTNKNRSFVQKLYFHHPANQSEISSYTAEAQKVDDFLRNTFQDGLDGMHYAVDENDGCLETPSLLYSLNKRRRWQLPELLETVIGDKEFIHRKNELSSKMHVSCMLRRTDLPIYLPNEWQLPKTPQILKLSSTAFGSTATPRRENGVSYMIDLIAKGIFQNQAKSSSLKKVPDDRRPRQNRRGVQRQVQVSRATKEMQHQNICTTTIDASRSMELGLTYYIATNEGFTDARKRKSNGCKKEKSRVTRSPSKWSSGAGRRGKGVPGQAHIKNSYEEDAAFLDDTAYVTENEELAIPVLYSPCFFDFFDLPLISRKVRKEHWRDRHAKSIPPNKASVIFVDTPDFAENTVVQELSDVNVKATVSTVSSQRLFHLTGDFGLLNQSYPSDDRALNGPMVTFSDIGVANAACLIFWRTFFGVQCLVKGPEPWLSSLQEFLSLRSLMIALLHPIVGPSLPSITSPKKLFSPRYQEDRCVKFLGPDFFGTNSNAPVARRGTCPICDNHSESVYVNPCGHLACDTCWMRYFAARFSNGVTSLVCMEQKCNFRADPCLAGLLAPWEVLHAWQSRSLDVVLSKLGAKWCPTANCSNIFLIESSNDKHSTTLLQCSKCGRELCRNCDQDWHWPCPCKEADSYYEVLRLHGDDLWSRRAKVPKYYAQTKRCPSCKLVMEKGEGCNSMVCNCGMNFCWLCAQPMSSHYGSSGYQACKSERSPVTIDVGGELDLHWKETAYGSAVEWRMRRLNLRKKSKFDRETMIVARFACYVLEHAFAYESQSRDPRICRIIRKEMIDFSFHVELLLGSTMTHRRAFHRNHVEAYMLRLRKVFEVRKAAAPA